MAETRIREALELLDGGRNWCQGDYEDTGGRLCIEGALSRVWGIPFVDVGYRNNPSWLDFKALCLVAKEHYEIGAASIFNDRHSTTFADVELVMEKAAVMREESVDG